MTLKEKKILYLKMKALLICGTIATSTLPVFGCDTISKKNENERVLGSIQELSCDIENGKYNSYNLDKCYALVQFGGSVQVIEFDTYNQKQWNTNVSFDTGDSFFIDNSNIIIFDIESESQLRMINNILEENQKETVPYTYVKKEY